MPAKDAVISSSIDKQSYLLFLVFGLLTLLSVFVGIATEMYFLIGLPAFLLLVYVTIVDFRIIFFLLAFCIPISTDIELPNGLATDLPTEPLMVGLMLVSLVYALRHAKDLSGNFIKHPLTLLVILHVAWIFVSSVTSSFGVVSFKFFLAKLWYVIVFFFLAAHILKTEKDYKILFWCVFTSLVFTVVSVLVRHSAYGFSFKDVYRVLKPFYSNHVIYAATIALFFPFVCIATNWYKRWSFKWFIIVLGILITFIGIQLSFTRAAILSLFIALGAYYIIKFRLIKLSLVASTIGAILLISQLLNNNTYLEYAPNFEKTVTHTNFDNLVEATYKLEDISTMERVYRWVAAGHMIADKPIVGFGPGNFYTFYKRYTVSSFRTYVSDNPERSGIHNYFMMVTVEQGLIGLIIFLLLTYYTLIKGEQVYHQTKDKERKKMIMVAMLSIIIIDALLLINDMIELDKVGSFYFIWLALIVNIDIANKKELD